MLDTGILAIVVAVFFILLILGVPIAFTLAFSGIIGLYLVGGGELVFQMLKFLPHRAIASFTFSAIPMFMIFGYLAEETGFGSGIFDSAVRWFGGLRAGTLVATQLASGIFAASSGSSVAAVVLFGRLALPELERIGFDKKLSLGAISSAGLLASTIPPSLGLVIYGLIAEQSVVQLFTAALLVGILQLVLYTGTIFVTIKIRPDFAPKLSRATWHQKFESLKGVWPLLLIVIIILGSIYAGIATVTESAALGAFVAVAVAVFTMGLRLPGLKRILIRTVGSSIMILAILMGGVFVSSYLARAGAVQYLTDAIAGSSALSPTVVLLLMVVFYTILGCFLDGASILILTVPVFVPVMKALGVDLIWFGVFVVLLCELGALTPPVGTNVFAMKSVAGADTSIEECFQGATYFFLPTLILIVALIFFPQLALWLPSIIRI